MDHQEISRHCFAVLVDNQPGVLARVVGMFAGRGYNIESLVVDEVDAAANLSRITIISRGTRVIIDQIAAQLGRLMPVRRVINLTEQGPLVERSCALLKVSGDAQQLAAAAALALKAGAHEVDTTDNAVIYEITGVPDVVNKLIDSLRTTGLVELASSGSVAMGCGAHTIL